MERYFKKPAGYIVKYDPSKHDIESLKDRFKECDKEGNPRRRQRKRKSKWQMLM